MREFPKGTITPEDLEYVRADELAKDDLIIRHPRYLVDNDRPYTQRQIDHRQTWWLEVTTIETERTARDVEVLNINNGVSTCVPYCGFWRIKREVITSRLS